MQNARARRREGGAVGASRGRARRAGVAKQPREARRRRRRDARGVASGGEQRGERGERLALRRADVVTRERLGVGTRDRRDGAGEHVPWCVSLRRRVRHRTPFREKHAATPRARPRARRVERHRAARELDARAPPLVEPLVGFGFGFGFGIARLPLVLRVFPPALPTRPRRRRPIGERRERLQVRRKSLEDLGLHERRRGAVGGRVQRGEQKLERGGFAVAAVDDAAHEHLDARGEVPAHGRDDVLSEGLQKRLAENRIRGERARRRRRSGDGRRVERARLRNRLRVSECEPHQKLRRRPDVRGERDPLAPGVHLRRRRLRPERARGEQQASRESGARHLVRLARIRYRRAFGFGAGGPPRRLRRQERTEQVHVGERAVAGGEAPRRAQALGGARVRGAEIEPRVVRERVAQRRARDVAEWRQLGRRARVAHRRRQEPRGRARQLVDVVHAAARDVSAERLRGERGGARQARDAATTRLVELRQRGVCFRGS